jgi:hypothetical protein
MGRFGRCILDVQLATVLACLPEVVGGLSGQPHIGAATALDAEPRLNTQRHFGRDRGVLVEHARERVRKADTSAARAVDHCALANPACR